MKLKNEQRLSIKFRLVASVIGCWILPIVIVVALAVMLLNNSYERSIRQELETGTKNAVRQMEMRFSAAFESSKAVSYDGVVRDAYRHFQSDGDSAALYSSVNSYLIQSFSRDEKFDAVFINFWENENVSPYVISQGTASYNVLRRYRSETEPQVHEKMKDEDTGIFFMLSDGQLFLVRNLLDSRFEPYATIAMMCNTNVMFQSVQNLSRLGNVQMSINGTLIQFDADGNMSRADKNAAHFENAVSYTGSLDGHEFMLSTEVRSFHLWAEMPELSIAVIAVMLLVLPLLAVIIMVFYRHVTHPIETLVAANARVQAGERGYIIEEEASNSEFQKLYDHFNSMSKDLKDQFDKLYLEQQALQQAKIKALQSQINPHFLNNTLEIINWEARLADNQRVCAMIEALSVMLDAALDRDGKGQIKLREELRYVDAYLYIIRERLGERFVVEKDIDETVLDQLIPRLILQPIVENAVEHDISNRRGGRLCVRVYRDARDMVLEVEHDGSMTDEDRENIRQLLSAPVTDAVKGGQVGVRNVNQRLKLMYGDRGSFTIEEIRPGIILAKVAFPAIP